MVIGMIGRIRPNCSYPMWYVTAADRFIFDMLCRIVRLIIVICCSCSWVLWGPPGGGRNDITGRFSRHLQDRIYQ